MKLLEKGEREASAEIARAEREGAAGEAVAEPLDKRNQQAVARRRLLQSN
jgi:hypothetical protein